MVNCNSNLLQQPRWEDWKAALGLKTHKREMRNGSASSQRLSVLSLFPWRTSENFREENKLCLTFVTPLVSLFYVPWSTFGLRLYHLEIQHDSSVIPTIPNCLKQNKVQWLFPKQDKTKTTVWQFPASVTLRATVALRVHCVPISQCSNSFW